MKLPRPTDQLAGCCWLPRFADKARRYNAGQLRGSYRAAFGSRLGVDGYFLCHFQFTRDQALKAVGSCANDEEIARWFLALPCVNAKSIESWNQLAPKLGSKGYPAYVTLSLVKFFLYPSSPIKQATSIFESIELDEKDEN